MAGSVPDLPGVVAPPEGAREIMADLARVLHRESLKFPGAQPVSFTRKHIQALNQEDYFVCEKSDGLRCLMFLSSVKDENGAPEERIYMITRKGEVSWVANLHVPSEPSNPRGFQVGTVLDGELVLSQDGKLRFFVFDTLAYEGKLLLERSLNKRLGYFNQFVYEPFVQFSRHTPFSESFDFKIYPKTMSPAFRLDTVLTQKRKHLSDGLIFTSELAPYIPGTDEYILKWKPANENSVDFAIRLDFSGSEDPNVSTDYWSKPVVTLLVWTGSGPKYGERDYAELYLTDEEWEDWKKLEEPLNYRIAEVVRDEEKRWRFLRWRDDKEHGNHVDVVAKVVESIDDSVSLEELSEHIPEIRRNWEEREAKRKQGSRRKEEEERERRRKRHGGELESAPKRVSHE